MQKKPALVKWPDFKLNRCIWCWQLSGIQTYYIKVIFSLNKKAVETKLEKRTFTHTIFNTNLIWLHVNCDTTDSTLFTQGYKWVPAKVEVNILFIYLFLSCINQIYVLCIEKPLEHYGCPGCWERLRTVNVKCTVKN